MSVKKVGNSGDSEGNSYKLNDVYRVLYSHVDPRASLNE